jgi:hypothetical protein
MFDNANSLMRVGGIAYFVFCFWRNFNFPELKIIKLTFNKTGTSIRNVTDWFRHLFNNLSLQNISAGNICLSSLQISVSPYDTRPERNSPLSIFFVYDVQSFHCNLDFLKILITE